MSSEKETLYGCGTWMRRTCLRTQMFFKLIKYTRTFLIIPVSAHFDTLHRSELKNWENLERELNDVRFRVLGPRNERTRSSTAFERSERAIRIKGARCYSMALNTQKPRNVAGPAAGGKVFVDDSIDENADLTLRRDMLKACIISLLYFHGTYSI